VAQDDDPVAEAYREHGRVYRFLLRRTGDPHQAEELAQRVFADAAAFLAETRPDSVLGWLYAVAERRFVDELRRRRLAADLPADPPRPATELDYGPAAARAIKRSIFRLDPASREVVVMKLLEGRPFAEIAGALGISEPAAKMRYSRALGQLRAFLEAEGIR
jgi:RNA polymerase sigma-70 factor, ECF subfamily